MKQTTPHVYKMLEHPKGYEEGEKTTKEKG
jgi:hypothetical protein